MTWISHRKEADKFIKIFSDNRILPSEWRYHLPIYIVQQPISVVNNARNFTIGMSEAIELYWPNLSDEYIATDPNSEQFMLF